MRRPTDADLIREALQAPFEHGTVYVTHFDVYETDFGYDSARIIVDAHLTEPPGDLTTWDHDDIHAMYRYVRELANELGLEQIVTAAVAFNRPAPLS
jgi:hypothetical protein